MFKFLHLADVHLDTTFLCRRALIRERLRSALRKAFKRAVDTALDERVHAVLIAGDLFDSDHLSLATERFLLEQLQRLDEAGIATIYVTGNHDPGSQRYRGGNLEWPSSFSRIAEGEAVVHEVADEGGRTLARVVGMGHASNRVESNLARDFPVAEDGVPYVGLLHTFVTSAEQVDAHDRYAPCSLQDLRRTGYRYWALGHIHKRQQVCDVSDAWYPGNIQGRNAREMDAKGGLLVTVDEDRPADVRFRSFAPIRWAELDIGGIASAHTFRDIARSVDAAFDELVLSETGTEEWLLRIRFSGRTPMADMLRDAEQRIELEEMLGRRLGVLDVSVKAERVTRPIDLERFRGEPHLLGTVLQLLEEVQSRPELLERFAPEPVAKECRTDAARRAYLTSLLAEMDIEAAERLLDESKL